MSALSRMSVAVALLGVLACANEPGERHPDLATFAATGAEPGQAPALDSVTHLHVIWRDDPRSRGFPSTITDSVTIHELLAFLDRHRTSWSKLADRAPQFAESPTVRVDVYRGPALLATLTYRDALELRLDGKDTRLGQRLAPTEVNALAGLLGLPIKVIAVPVRQPM